MKPFWLAAVSLVALTTGCTTKFGTNIAVDRMVPAGALVEPIGRIQGSASAGQAFWAVDADRELYERARQAALKDKGGDVLINAKITTTLTSYWALYYRTDIAIEGTAARLVLPPAAPPAPAPSGSHPSR